MGRRIKVIEKLAIAAAGSNTNVITLPRAHIERIQISVNTAITVSAGSVVANTSIKEVLIRYNGKQIIRIAGLGGVDDLQSAGMELIRELEGQRAGVALTDDFWIISFPKPLPPGDVQVEFTCQTAEQIGANAAGTITAGDHMIEIEVRDKPPVISNLIPYVVSGSFADLNKTGDLFHYLPSIAYRLRLLGFITHDAGVRSNTTYDSLQIQLRGDILFDGTLAKLINEFQQKSGLALNAGNFFKSFGKNGIKVEPDSLLLKFAAATAGVTKNIEWIAIAW